MARALLLGLVVITGYGCAWSSLLGEADDAGVADGAPVDSAIDDDCAAWLVPCGGACVDVFSESAHCGSCGRACGAGAGCVDGACVPSVPTGPPPARCVGVGPAITLGEGDVQICTGALAAATFTRALCSCDAIGMPSLGGALLADAFDSSVGAYAPGGGAAPVGANGVLSISSDLDVSDLVLGEGSVRGSGRTDTIRARSLAIEGALSVRGDAYVQSFVDGGGTVRIDGTLRTSLACAALPAGVSAAACSTETFDLEAPCRCDGLAIAEIVDVYANPSRHDNDEVGLSPDVLAGPGATGRIDLACGHYYLTRIAAAGPITIAVHGRTAIYVGGSILADAPIAWVVDPGATLDVFVGGTVLARAPLHLGAPERPVATRVWVGGECSEGGGECDSDADCCSTICVSGSCAAGGDGDWAVRLEPSSEIAALLAAPEAPIVAGGSVVAYGAVVGAGYHAAGETSIHFDRAVLDSAAECAVVATCADVPECGSEVSCTDGRTCLAGCCVELGEPG